MVQQIVVTITTTKLEASIAFYTGVLKFSVKDRIELPSGVTLVFLNSNGFIVELVCGPHIPGGEIGSGAPLLTFMVPDFNDIDHQLANAGIDLPKSIKLPRGEEMMRFKDPNGVVISFVAGQF